MDVADRIPTVPGQNNNAARPGQNTATQGTGTFSPASQVVENLEVNGDIP